jgi:nucleoside-diphosphate-sugar epimerase
MIGITGGTSGLGKRLTEYLITKGYKVKVLARQTSQVNDLVKWGVELVYGDINEPTSLIPFIKDIDLCYHLAAQLTATTKERLFTVNVTGTKNICEAIIKYNSNCRLVYCSSIVVKGVHFYNRAFLSNYTISKYKAEKIVNVFEKKYHLKAGIIYPGYIYGPYDRNYMRYKGFNLLTFTTDGCRVDAEFQEEIVVIPTGKVADCSGLHSIVINSNGQLAKFKSYNDTYSCVIAYTDN